MNATQPDVNEIRKIKEENQKLKADILKCKSQTRFVNYLKMAEENLELAEQLQEAKTRIAFLEGLRSAK